DAAAAVHSNDGHVAGVPRQRRRRGQSVHYKRTRWRNGGAIGPGPGEVTQMKQTSNHRQQRGVALVELALITPLLLLLTFITTEFGRPLYEYNLVVNSTRDAVRHP